MWAEVTQALESKKHNVKISKDVLDQRLKESGGALPAAVLDALAGHVTTLELSDSSTLSALPASLACLTNLLELVLSHDVLHELPPEIVTLAKLRALVVDYNQLPTLPPDIGALAQLQILNVSHNLLTSLPTSVGRLQSLITLEASYNQIASIPIELCQLPRLSSLQLNHNGLSNLPNAIGQLTTLTSLGLEHNKLVDFPSGLGDCLKAKLSLDGNPIADKKLVKIVKEGKPKNILLHIKKFGSKASSAAAAPTKPVASKPQPKPYQVLPYQDDSDVFYNPNVKDCRPHIACALLHGLRFTPKLLERFFDLQTELHQSLCDKRKLAAIGSHDFAKLVMPLTYSAAPWTDIVFPPLLRASDSDLTDSPGPSADEPSAMPASELPARFANDQTMLKYLSYLPKGDQAYLRDGEGRPLGLSPVINSNHCRVDVGTSDVFLECTSPASLALCQTVLTDLLARLADALLQEGQALRVSPVKVKSLDGHVRLTFPADK